MPYTFVNSQASTSFQRDIVACCDRFRDLAVRMGLQEKKSVAVVLNALLSAFMQIAAATKREEKALELMQIAAEQLKAGGVISWPRSH